MSSILLTGFPGFLGTRLLPQLLLARPEDTAVCIVQPKYMDLARRRVLELVASEASLDGRIRLREGDISLPGLGLGAPDRLIRATEDVFHLAAVYDLSVGRELATRVNVDGTVHLLDFAERCPSLRRIHYVSTWVPFPPSDPLRQHLLRQRATSGSLPGVRSGCGTGVQQSL